MTMISADILVEHVKKLDRIAKKHFENNRSMALRHVIKNYSEA